MSNPQKAWFPQGPAIDGEVWRDMAGRSQSWRDMTAGAKVFISLVVVAGTGALVYGAINPTSLNISKFICYLLVALLASRLKVNLPGITGTMSVNFLFILLGVLELSFAETLVLGTAAILVQCFYRDRPSAIQVTFNICASALSIATAWTVYHLPLLQREVGSHTILLVVAASVYFVANTGSIATIIALTEHKSLNKIWVECYFWSFPYYLVGAGIAGVVGWFNRSFEWQTSLLIVPVIYLIYRSYRLYLGKLEDEKRHVEEMANLHLRTIEALALAIEAKDHTTHDHLQRVRVYAIEVAKDLGVTADEMEALHAAALLHDIGKLAVPEHIISKPGRLTPEEFEKMKIHPVVGRGNSRASTFPLPGRAHRPRSPRTLGRLRLSLRIAGGRNPDRCAHSVGRGLHGRSCLRPPVSPRFAAGRSDAATGEGVGQVLRSESGVHPAETLSRTGKSSACPVRSRRSFQAVDRSAG